MTVAYEPFSAEVRDDPYPVYTRLREHAPLHWAEETEAWCVSRHADVVSVLRSPENFSSDAMRTMLLGVRPGVDPAADPAMLGRLLAFSQSLPFSLQELMTSRQLISEDPPRHGALRALVNRGFTPRRIAAWEPRMREIVAECLLRLRDGEAFDVVHDLAIPLPVRIIAEMLGVEPERQADFKRWSDLLMAALTGSARSPDPLASGLAEVMRELCEYIQGVVARRTQAPGDDLISVLLTAQDDARLKVAELTFFVVLLLVAGNETTTNLIGNATHALLRHPEQLARVRADRGLVPSLVEETLRWDAPVQVVFRRATREVEIAGGRIPAGSHVVPLLGSANRDERQWGPTAADFDVARNPQGHVGFGFGIHFCLGASLARLEARVALEALVEELPRLQRCEPKLEFVDSFLVRGPRRLPLRRAA